MSSLLLEITSQSMKVERIFNLRALRPKEYRARVAKFGNYMSGEGQAKLRSNFSSF